MKKIKDDFNVTSNLRYIFQRAPLISDDLKIGRIDTLSVLIAMLKDNYSKINEIYAQNFGTMVDVDYIIDLLIRSKEFYEKIVGKNFPFTENDDEKVAQIEEQIAEKKEEVIKQECMEAFEQIEESTDSEDDVSQEAINLAIAAVTELITQGQTGFEYDYGIPYSDNLKKAIFDAGKRCRDCGRDYIDEENLMYSILNLEDCSAKRLLEWVSKDVLPQLDIDVDLIDVIELLIDSSSICFSATDNKLVIPKPLEGCCKILNDKYEKGVKCDILGRDEEIYRIWRILSKKQKSNVVLLGEAGVGKSAIVEALTMSIVNGTCPKKFKDFRVVELNVSGMIAGTKYRGEFEKKVEYLEELINNNDNLIIFVDEMHHVMGAGSAEGSGPDLSGSLKPILARDKVKFIGATTLAEYKMYICRDNAFRRRLEPINIKEPKQSQVPAMIKAKVDSLKKYHGVTINKKVLDEIQMYASCFNVSTCNPDKTIDLVDTVMGIAANEGSKSTTSNHIKEWFKPSYEQYEKTPKKVNMNTAYHEAGHFYLHYIYKDVLVDQEVYALSILPGFDFLGANILELTESVPNRDREYYEAEIAALLGGRIAEEIFFDNVTTGASNDLGKVGALIRANIVRGGLSKSVNDFYNVSLYDEETGNVLPFSDSAIDKINREVKEITDKVYNTHKIMLSEPNHKANLKLIADILLKKKIVSAKELIEAIESNN